VAPRQEDDSDDDSDEDDEDEDGGMESRYMWQRLSEKEKRREMYGKDDVG
jgi:hypothetical protein